MACAQELDEQNIPAEPHQAGATRSLSTLLEIITEPLLHIRDFLSQGDVKGKRQKNRMSAIDQRQVSDCMILLKQTDKGIHLCLSKKISTFSLTTTERRVIACFVLHWSYRVNVADEMEVYLAQNLFCKCLVSHSVNILSKHLYLIPIFS